MNKFLAIATEPEPNIIPGTSGVPNKQKPVNRKYNPKYMRYGVTCVIFHKATAVALFVVSSLVSTLNSFYTILTLLLVQIHQAAKIIPK